jgi:hypothetical protein
MNVNSVALLFVAVYLISVVFHGNHDELIKFMEKQTPFLKWGAALFILVLIYDETKSNVVADIIIIALIAMLLIATNKGGIENLTNFIQNFFK